MTTTEEKPAYFSLDSYLAANPGSRPYYAAKKKEEDKARRSHYGVPVFSNNWRTPKKGWLQHEADCQKETVAAANVENGLWSVEAYRAKLQREKKT